jgi:hypothetical protein
MKVRVERDASMFAAQQRLQGALTGFDRLGTQILAVELRAGRKRKGQLPGWAGAWRGPSNEPDALQQACSIVRDALGMVSHRAGLRASQGR